MDNFSIEGPRIVFRLTFGGLTLNITETLFNSWIVMIIISALVIWLGSNLKRVPTTKRQAVAEMAVNFMNKFVDENLGTGLRKYYAPYLTAIFIFILLGSLIGLLGFRAVPSDISFTGSLAAMTFAMILYNKIKYNGIGGYLKGLASPPILTPFNILSEFATPVSMAMRLFGNLSGGGIITALIYTALAAASAALYGLIGLSSEVYYFNIFQVGVPAVLSIYFDLFSGVIQSYVFIILTLAYIKNGKEG